MKKLFRKLIICISVLSCILSMSVFSVRATNDIHVQLDGKELSFDVPPQIINDRTMVPMRAIFEALGYDVQWRAETQAISAINKQADKYISMIIDNSIIIACAYSDWLKSGYNANFLAKNMYTLEQSPTIIDGRTLVPVRAISEMSGCNVEWNGDLKTVVITSSGSNNQSNQYYKDTNIPTYTCVTGINLQRVDTEKNAYIYDYDKDSYLKYAQFLTDNGWSLYDSSVEENNNLLNIYFVKNGQMVLLSAAIDLNRVFIVIPN